MLTTRAHSLTAEEIELTVILPLVLNKQALAKTLVNAHQVQPAGNLEFVKLLFQLFNLSELKQLPAGAMIALAAGLPASQGEWLRADPVQITVNTSNAYLSGNSHLQLTPQEIAVLAEELNRFLQHDNLQLHLLNDREWCLELTEEPKIKTHILTEVIGKPLQEYLPQGEAGQKWRMLLTELQMLLATSPVNIARAAQQQPLISSLWFWGEGHLPTASVATQWQRVWSSNLLVQGLAKYTHTPVTELVVNFNECFNNMRLPGHYLLDLSTLPSNWLKQEEGDVDAVIDSQWLKPMLTAYQTGQLSKVTLYDSSNGVYQLNSKRKRAWWQKLLPFKG